MQKIKLIMILLMMSVLTHAGENFSFLYKIEKGGKKLGYYEVNLAKDSVVSNSYGAANRLEMFSTKKTTFIKDGIKNVDFTKNKKTYKFIVVTKVSALDTDLKKQYDRKFKKVKNNEMLFITKNTKKRIELFNKRKTTIKTFDELLADIYNNNLTYDKFILFDKLGVMKMVAKVTKESDAIVITNASKNKPYMKITLDGQVPTKIESLLSNWSATLEKSGTFKEHKVDLIEMVSKSYVNALKPELKTALVEFTKTKKTKSSYEFSGHITYTLSPDISAQKTYKQKEHCKKLFKKSKVKFKKIKLEVGSCVANIKATIKIKKLKKDILEVLTKKHKQLKMTKKIRFNKNSITYEVL